MAKGHRTISRLLDKSIESFILSLETINRLSIKYRAESFLILICNSWELLLKARIIQASNDPKAIYYPKKDGEKLRTLALRDCVKRVITNDADPTRVNIEWVADFRDECTHHFISKLPKTCMSLFQACVLNYHSHLKDWFNTSLSDRVPIGMMTLVYDFDPIEYDLTRPQLRRELGHETVSYLLELEKALEAVAHGLGQSKEFSIPIDYRLVLTKSAKAGDIFLTNGPAGTPTGFIPVPKDAAKTHPYRQKDLIKELCGKLGAQVVNAHDLLCVRDIHHIQQRNEFFYQSSVTGSPVQYSDLYVDWLVEKIQKDNKFLDKTRQAYKAARQAAKSGQAVLIKADEDPS